jgi:hypothetical protein
MKPVQVTFTFEQTAEVAQCLVTTLNNWFTKKQIWFGKHELVAASRRGASKRLTIQGVFKVAIMAHLTRVCGMRPARAWEITMAFTEAGALSEKGGQLDRLPGQLFKQGETYLAAVDGGPGRVFNAPPLSMMASGVVTVCVNLNKIQEQVHNALHGTS